MMVDTQEMERLREENRRLREDNEKLMKVIAQMKVTLNCLVNRYFAGK